LKLSAIVIAVALGLSALSCGGDDGGPTPEVLVGKYSATFAYTATLGPPWSLSDSRSCYGTVTIDDEAGGEFSGHFAIVDDLCLLEPVSGDISGTIDSDGNVAVVGLYATTVEFDRYECGISDGSTLMNGQLTDAGFSVDASATFACSARGFEPVDVFTELIVTAVLQ
jgi:hypothetical protein